MGCGRLLIGCFFFKYPVIECLPYILLVSLKVLDRKLNKNNFVVNIFKIKINKAVQSRLFIDELNFTCLFNNQKGRAVKRGERERKYYFDFHALTGTLIFFGLFFFSRIFLARHIIVLI